VERKLSVETIGLEKKSKERNFADVKQRKGDLI
jgi:hypothetical protein